MRISDLNRLLPSMRVTVERLLKAMEAEDLAPKVLETYRTPQRAAELVTKGTSKTKGLSMHVYGAAVDICCDNHLYDCAKWGCPFFTLIGREGERLGMIWGHRFPSVDSVHWQGIAVAEQGKLRSMGYGPDSWLRRDKLIAKSIAARRQSG